MTAFVERTWQITAGAVWTAMMLAMGFVSGWAWAIANVGAC